MALYIGLMSGTSVDAIDAALVDISQQNIQVIASGSTPVPPLIREQVIHLFIDGENEIDRMGDLDCRLGQLFAEAANSLLSKHAISNKEIIAIGSHGQTIRHRPRPHQGNPFTVQIGDPNTIAELTQITTVADFRRRDMACGGQGAPLAPAFHQAAFASESANRAILNIGGIANVTLLKPGEKTQGYDIGPGNGLMDAWIQRSLQRSYDADGAWAASGSIHPELLNSLLQHPYFALTAPKSTGREEFTLSWLEQQLTAITINDVDVQATLAEFCAFEIARQLGGVSNLEELYVCGGGVHNQHLMQRLQQQLPHLQIQTTAALGVPADDVEAAAFAWLAQQTLNHLPGNLKSVTGAHKNTILGGIYPAGIG